MKGGSPVESSRAAPASIAASTASSPQLGERPDRAEHHVAVPKQLPHRPRPIDVGDGRLDIAARARRRGRAARPGCARRAAASRRVRAALRPSAGPCSRLPRRERSGPCRDSSRSAGPSGEARRAGPPRRPRACQPSRHADRDRRLLVQPRSGRRRAPAALGARRARARDASCSRGRPGRRTSGPSWIDREGVWDQPGRDRGSDYLIPLERVRALGRGELGSSSCSSTRTTSSRRSPSLRERGVAHGRPLRLGAILGRARRAGHRGASTPSTR